MLALPFLSLDFPKARRLTRAGEFQQVRERGKALHSRLVVLSILDPAPDGLLRIGIITSKRVGGAVERNRVRRRLREIFRLNQHRLHPGIWIVTIARNPAKDVAWDRLQSDWLQLAGRASILSAE